MGRNEHLEADLAGSERAQISFRFGCRLRQWRESKTKKIAEAAGEMGVATASWGHWETGRSMPSITNLLLLAQYTGIPIQHFLCPNTESCPFAPNTR